MSSDSNMSQNWDHNDAFHNSSSPLQFIEPGMPSTNSPPRSHRHASSTRSSEMRLLCEDLRDAKKLAQKATSQYQAEVLRASEAERQLQEITAHLKRVNEARLVALQDAARANEELKLYKVQFAKAQEEIFRAQNVLDKVDRARYEAEKEAAEARTTSRKLQQTIIIQAAKEEGRRAGLQEGLERGRLMGYQEAQLMAQYEEDESYYDEDGFHDEYDDRYRPRSRYITSSEDIHAPRTREPSRVPSRAPSQAPSRGPSRRPSPPLPPPPSSDPAPTGPTPIPPPQPTPHIRPRSFRNVSPSPRRANVPIPPDGYIPSMDADDQIRIPPPHELSRPPPTPERMQSPPLPSTPVQEPLPTRLRTMTPHRHRVPVAHSSPGSNSTTLSQFDMVNDPEYATGRQSPLSVIPEGSTHTSPNPASMNGQGLRHQSSWGGSSRKSNAAVNVPTPRPPIIDLGGVGSSVQAQQFPAGPYTRPRNDSSSTESVGPSNPPGRRFSSVSTIPDIDIHPPSRPQSDGTPRADNGPHSGGHLSSLHANRPYDPEPANASYYAGTPISGVLLDGQLPQGFVPSGGYTPASTSGVAPMSNGYQTPQFTRPESFSDGGPPVIPDRSLFQGDIDDDAQSSADTLATPPQIRGPLPRGSSPVPSLDTLMTPPNERAPLPSHRPTTSDTSWFSATQAAADVVPLPASVMNAMTSTFPNVAANNANNGAGAARKKGKRR